MAHLYRLLGVQRVLCASTQSYTTLGKNLNSKLIATVYSLSNCYREQLFIAPASLCAAQVTRKFHKCTPLYSSKFYEDNNSPENDNIFKYGAFVAIGAALLFMNTVVYSAKAIESQSDPSVVVPNLPTFTSGDVSKHDSKENRIWVSFQHGVYDITDFVDQHPGGDQILLAAGGSLEPFWLLYAAHQTTQIKKLLESFRIGNLSEEDQGASTVNMDDPYAAEPRRHPALKPSSVKPFNAEPPMQLLVENFHTPSDLFFVRNHLPVPHVDDGDYQLEVTDLNGNTLTLSLADLKNRFPKYVISATIQCAGNRRSELTKVKPVKGLSWGAAAISNATWGGAKLRDVLMHAGLTDDDKKVVHIHFEGLDTDTTGVPYGASILRDKAMDPLGDVIVAYEMNGHAIPVDHGFPVRLVAPGVVGARNVKWLSRIIMSEHESDSHWQQNDYKGFSPNTDWDTVDFKSAPAIQELPVQSAICQPTDGSTVNVLDGTITVKGYAWSGGGRKIVRVDVSGDGGLNWHTATFNSQSNDTYFSKDWAWRLWQVNIPVPPGTKNNSSLELICKATDIAYNCQPENTAGIWNLRGVLNNAWHRITIKLKINQ